MVSGDKLVLTVTRDCNHRCSYCPTAKEGWPSLSAEDAVRAADLFAAAYGGGDIKLFGGEPLLLPQVVRAVLEHARQCEAIRFVFLSTNGLGLTDEWLDYLASHPKAVLTISLDGQRADHRRHRQPLPGMADAYDHVMSLRAKIVRTPRVIVAQTIAPDVAATAARNFGHLRSLGFFRFNFLPCYYVRWQPEQVAALREGFETIAGLIRKSWERGEPLYVKNLFHWAPTPLFNPGMVVDSDGSIHASNVGLSCALEGLLELTRVGSLDEPPAPEAIARAAERLPELLPQAVTPDVWQSTVTVDEELSRFCRELYPAFLAYRKNKDRVA